MVHSNYRILLDELKRILPNNRLVKYLDIKFSLRGQQNADQLISSVLDSLAHTNVSPAWNQTTSKEDMIYNPEDCDFNDSVATESIDWKAVLKPAVIKKDYRIKKIILENFRKFPAAPKDDKGSFPFGVSFMNAKSQPCSAVILGSNGVGKSSIYESIEYLYRKDIGEAHLRDYGRWEDSAELAHTRYLTNWNHRKEDLKVEMEVVGDEKINRINLNAPLKLQNEALTGCLENCFFISEYEIIRYGQMKFEHGGRNSLRMQLAKALDFGDLAWLDRLLFKLSILEKKEIPVDPSYYKERIEECRLKIEENKKYFGQVEILVGLDMSTEDRTHFLSDFLRRFKTISEYKISEIIQNIVIALTAILQERFSHDVPSKKSIERLLKNGKEILEGLKKLENFCEEVDKENEQIKGIVMLRSLSMENGSLLNALSPIITDPFREAFSDMRKDLIETQDLIELQELVTEFVKQIRSKISIIEKAQEERQTQFGWLEFQDEIEDFHKNYSFNQLRNKINENERLQQKIVDLEYKQAQYLIQCEASKVIQCIRQEAYQIYQLVHTEISGYFKKEVEDVNEKVIQKVMHEFLDEEDVMLTWTWDKWDIVTDNEGLPMVGSPPQYLSCKIKNTRLNTEMSVKKYFNTFRYHLFNTILNIALSFSIMRKLDVRMPVVLDDIFYASDFSNRNKIKNFIKTILISYETIFNDDKEIPNKPLQLIIFTHDEMIFKGIWEMIGSLNSSGEGEEVDSLRCKYDFLFYTLLPYQEAEENEYLQMRDLMFNFNLQNDDGEK